MGVKSFIKKSVAFVSAVAMACSMVVMPAGVSYAAEGEEVPKGTLELSKSLTLDNSGVYKIKLEAYATGEDTVNTIKTSKPMDIVLVLDQSGSMSYNMGYEYKKVYNVNRYNSYYILQNGQYTQVYYYNNGWYYFSGLNPVQVQPKASEESSQGEQFYSRSETKRLDALISAVNGFVTAVENNANPEKGEKINHRIAVVGFSSSGYNNTEILSGVNISSENIIRDNNTYYPDNKAYNGVQYDSNSDSYKAATTTALQDVSTEKGQTNIANAIAALTAHGGTQTDQGMQMAKDILDNAPEPEQNADGRKKLVIMFTDGEPTGSGSSFSNHVANNAISIAKDIKTSATNPATIYTVGIFNGADPNGTDDANEFMNYVSSNYSEVSSMSDNNPTRVENGKYYKVASDSSQLSEVFEQIQNEQTTTETTVKLNASSVLRDIISDKFTLPAGITTNDITAYTVNAKYNGDTLGWDESTKNSNGLSVEITGEKNNTVNVTGFDYAAHYVTKAHAAEAKKLVVEIPVNGKISGKQLASNASESGVYASSTDETAFKNFEQPTVDIPEYSYVLDYGKKVVLPNVDANTKNVFDSTQSKNYSATTMMNSTLAAPLASTVEDKTTLRGTYGTFKLESSGLTYQPGKINWDGFDSIFTLGQKSDNSYEWYKTNVIPATSVYYEDDFNANVTNGDSGTKIVYSEGDWTLDGSKQNTREQSSSNSQYGWESSYANDTAYTDGTAHKSSTSGATATFKFTGTGVDIYSKTDLTTGKVLATLTKDGETAASKFMIVDNKAASGTYYQVPTLFFDNLEYGTYEVKIQVLDPITEGDETDQTTRGTYYLDGIRVYNPLGSTLSETAKGAYDIAGETNALFTSVRNVLLDAKTFSGDNTTAGAVFIDQITSDATTGSETAVIGTYEKLGPKNEVYLAKDQAIAFKINTPYTGKVFIGAKSLTGQETEMKVTDSVTAEKAKSIKFKHTSDMYYEVTPTSEGYVVIQNLGEPVLAITKLRLTGVDLSTNEIQLESNAALMSYASTFALLDAAETDETGMALEKETPDVDVDNPDISDDKEDEKPNFNSIWNSILSSIQKWFGRR